ncbi:MAG TPA: hypothetical protein VKV26_18715 [Dehalococcoidia bacterium]|nr:hypothetical protein [Dehalococcoidia bacterium]
MDVEFIRSGERTYHCIAYRHDGVCLRVSGAGRILPLPHDLVHFVIERELGLTGGFWGSVADGVLFGSITVVSGRQRPHAAERSRTLLRANAELLLQAEVVAGALDAIVAEGADANAQQALRRLNEAQSAVRIGRVPMDVVGLRRVCAVLREAADGWQKLPFDQPLALRWPEGGRERTRRSHRERRRQRASAAGAGAA